MTLVEAVEVGTDRSRIWVASGLYFAEVPVPGQEAPIKIALHGVRTLSQAKAAVQVFEPEGRRHLQFERDVL